MLSTSFRSTTVALACVGMIVSLALHVLLAVYADTPAIKASSPLFW